MSEQNTAPSRAPLALAPRPPLLEIKDLHTDIRLRRSTVHAVAGVDLTVHRGETLGIVGESGCGKTMTALSIMQLLPTGGEVVKGVIRLDGDDLVGLSEDELRRIRGGRIGMVFQDPLTSLNPTMTVGAQIAETVRLHQQISRAAAFERAREMLDRVGIARARSRLTDYPHQFSGGMRQRVMIAMALSCSPDLLIADEPTTALDVTIQAQILDLIDELRRDLSMAVVLVTHDLGVIAGRADRVAIMYAGRVVEAAKATPLFDHPRHRYTEALFSSLPERSVETRAPLRTIPGMPPDLTNPPQGCRFAARCGWAEDDCRAFDPPLVDDSHGHEVACLHPVPRRSLVEVTERPTAATPLPPRRATLLSVRGLTKDFPLGGSMFRRARGTVSAVSDVSFDVHLGQTMGLVGESGCGKTTTGRLIVGLDQPTSGSVSIDGVDLATLSRSETRKMRRQVQFMFQDPYSSLDPRMRAGSIIREPLQIQGIGSPQEQLSQVGEMLTTVGLPRAAADRYPHEFSGGQRQRIGLARALTLHPRLIVADEPVSALDVSVQAQILNTMRALQQEFSLTLVVISHNLSVIRYLSDTIGVMYLGKLVEDGPSDEVYNHPLHPYTRGLIDTIPLADPRRERARLRISLSGEPPSAIDPPSGCRFHTRCPFAQARCAEEVPALRPLGAAGHRVACHFPLEEGRLPAPLPPAT